MRNGGFFLPERAMNIKGVKELSFSNYGSKIL